MRVISCARGRDDQGRMMMTATNAAAAHPRVESRDGVTGL